MIHIKFKDVLKGKPYKTSGYEIPTVAGVYIYGLLLDVRNDVGTIEKKFCPLAVGESNNLWRRLNKDKYLKYIPGGDGVKELFDFSNKSYTRAKLRAIYDDMQVYDLHLNGRNKLFKLIKIIISGGIKNLIYFQDFNFFNQLLKLPPIKPNDNKPHPVAVSDLRKINSGVSNTFADKIEETKKNYEEWFYFVLAYDEPTGAFDTKRAWENIESNAKWTLQKKNIFTTEKHRGKDVPVIHIDLSDIKNILTDL